MMVQETKTRENRVHEDITKHNTTNPKYLI